MSGLVTKVRLRLALFGALSAAACGGAGSSETAAAPPPPARREASTYLPADLDFAATLDWGRLRAELPPGTSEGLLALARRTSASDDTAEDVVADALDSTHRLWIAGRPGRSTTTADVVLVLEGNFARVSPAARARAFLPARELGGGWSVQDVKRITGRAAPARLYTYRDELWIVASEAEIDAVDRTVELGRSGSGLSPTPHGLVSVAVRVQPILSKFAKESPKLTELLDKARSLEASGDWRADGLSARITLDFETTDDAARIERALDTLLFLMEHSGHSPGIEGLRTDVVERSLVVEGRVPSERIQSWMAAP